MRGSRGSTGGPDPTPPLKNHEIIGFISNTVPDPLKMTKLSSLHSMSGYHRHASETPFKWRFAVGPMMTRLYVYLDPFINKKKKKKKKKKKRCKVGPPPAKLSGSAYVKTYCRAYRNAQTSPRQSLHCSF